MGLLREKVALVTGASSGIGRATAVLFAREGARVVLAARNAAALDDVVAQIGEEGGQAVAMAGDVRDERYAKALVDLARSSFGGLDIAFNNAGANGQIGATPDVTLEGWHEAIDTNLTGAFLGARHQLPALAERRGVLLFTGSFVGHTAGFPGTAAYAASKAGLIGLVQSLAVEFGGRGVRVNAILPGATDTPLARQWAPDEASREFIRNLYALKRYAQPEEIAQAALFLASDAASFVTGIAMPVEGGVSINRT
ncbi:MULTISPECIES: SDR family oxidoreductase [Dyella]|uniref:SDR family oxidoreductase n=2 Tax=Dyella TaxID=231454 RepID=A0A4R0YJ97_9GAMM|nr:SDR family oxidoreductase [Dyella soli]TBR36388.1 SDR family oxidoreductase [Dyella terrae]TCI05942.1 SDR family oxidoreductase [Dyella soli]